MVKIGEFSFVLYMMYTYKSLQLISSQYSLQRDIEGIHEQAGIADRMYAMSGNMRLSRLVGGLSGEKLYGVVVPSMLAFLQRK